MDNIVIENEYYSLLDTRLERFTGKYRLVEKSKRFSGGIIRGIYSKKEVAMYMFNQFTDAKKGM